MPMPEFRRAVASALAVGLLALAACSSSKPPKPRAVTPVVRDVPAILRGTIGAEATINGEGATWVSGLGLVVGLNGTGGSELPERIAAHMERELNLRLETGGEDPFYGTALAGMNARQILRDPNVAVVVVFAAVPPGSPVGTPFDVGVQALNISSTTSLEGGTLWTTDLRIGQTPAVFGGMQAHKIAEAGGQVFINPFAEPNAVQIGVSQRTGRVLDGGVVTDPLQMELRLDNPSHQRARAVVSSINTRFPEGPGDHAPTARGRDESSIALIVPTAHRDKPEEFIQIIKHLRIGLSDPRPIADRYVRAVIEQPELYGELMWCMVALGKGAMEPIRQLYEYPETKPKLAGLAAGARLGDVRAADALRDMAWTADQRDRPDAISLLGILDAGPKVDRALHTLLGDEALTIRVAAYEALSERAEQAQLRRLIIQRQGQPVSAGQTLSMTQLQTISRAFLPEGTVQDVSRQSLEGQFFLDRVPYGDRLIYITQHGTPKVVLFGEDLDVVRPTMMTAWSGDLMFAADSETDDLRVYFHPRGASRAINTKAPTDLGELVAFMAHVPTPEDPRPGLSMTYSQVVGALYELHKQGAVKAAFATQQDRLAARVLQAQAEANPGQRPEFADSEDELLVFPVELPRLTPEPEGPAQDEPSLVVPIVREDGTSSGAGHE